MGIWVGSIGFLLFAASYIWVRWKVAKRELTPSSRIPTVVAVIIIVGLLMFGVGLMYSAIKRGNSNPPAPHFWKGIEKFSDSYTSDIKSDADRETYREAWVASGPSSVPILLELLQYELLRTDRNNPQFKQDIVLALETLTHLNLQARTAADLDTVISQVEKWEADHNVPVLDIKKQYDFSHLP